MTLTPPAGFTGVVEAQRRRDQEAYNVIGICTDYLPPAQSRGSDLAMKLNLWDCTCIGASDVSTDGILVRFFSQNKGFFPRVEEIGDVVILRNVKTKNQGSAWFGMSSYMTSHIVISGPSLADSTDPSFADVELRSPKENNQPLVSHQGPAPSLSEFKYAKMLLAEKDPSTFRAPPRSTALDVASIIKASGGQAPPMGQLKYRMLKDLVNPSERTGLQFADLLGEICRVYLSSNPVEVFLTDYTEHSLLFDYGNDEDSMSAPDIPKGKMTIRVNLWDEHADYVRKLASKDEIQIGMYMRVKNVNIKMDRNQAQLEGHLRGSGGNFGSAVTLHRPRDAAHDDALKHLLQRRRMYDVERKAKALGLEKTEHTGQKRQAASEPAFAHQQPAKGSRSLNKKKKEKRKQQQEAERSERTYKDYSNVHANQNIRCEAVNIPLTTIAAILDSQQLQRHSPSRNPFTLPFQNCKYRSKVQVFDFFPDNLEDFAAPYRRSDYEALSDHESEDDSIESLTNIQKNSEEVKWEWHFFLMVEDPISFKKGHQGGSPLVLQVVGHDGDYLLNMEACDLRNNPQELAKLKEKLFMLWGDLEEKKVEHGKTGEELLKERVSVSSMPFECLIQEYGVQARDEHGQLINEKWERMFKLFKTNIG